MSRIAEAIERIKSTRWIQLTCLPSIEQYINTGEPKALAKITPFGQRGSYWANLLVDALAPVDAWTVEDRRAVHVLAAAALDNALWQWIDGQLAAEGEEQDVHGVVRQELKASGLSEADIVARTLRQVGNLTRGGKPTSAGRWLLSLPPAELKSQLAEITLDHPAAAITELAATAGPARMDEVVELLLSPGRAHRPDDVVVEKLLKHFGGRYEDAILASVEQCKNSAIRFAAVEKLHAFDRQKFRSLAFDAARDAMLSPGNEYGPARKWLIENAGSEAIPVLVAFFAKDDWLVHWGYHLLNEVAEKLGREGAAVQLAALDACRKRRHALPAGDPERIPELRREKLVRQAAIGHLIALKDAVHDARILEELRDGLTAPDTDTDAVIAYLGLAAKWDIGRLQNEAWPLTGSKSKPVREAAARALAKLGDAGIPQAKELLRHKKADSRLAAVTLLAAVGTPAALAELEARVDKESSDDVRDQVLLGLAEAWAKQGRQVTRADIEARVAKSADKLKMQIAPWADPAKLPPLKWSSGGPLGPEVVAYLLYRQSRAKEMKPDVEAAPLYRLIDRGSSGEFSRALLRGFLGSKQEASDRWAMAAAALLGDDRIVPDLAGQIREWVDANRGKLAEYAVQALALQGSDAAMLAVDAMAVRYRSKMKNVGRAAAEAFAGAAEQLGISTEELGDRVVPWLGFEPGKPRVVELGKTKLEAIISSDLKLTFKDLEKNKPVKSLPKSAPAPLLAEFKEVSANLKEAAKAQLLRLENLLVRQRRWPAVRWKQLFLQHPVLLPFAARLVWGHYDDSGKQLGTFRALEDRSLTTREDEPYDLPDAGTVGMVHPLELTEQERLAWQTHLSDYEVEPPFPQLEREVVAAKPEQAPVKICQELAGTSINAMTFKGRAERLGWYRGSVCDGGGITSYYKSFPAAAADVFLGLANFYIGIDMYADVKLGNVTFVRHGSVKVGSYTYDEPSNEKDPRLLAMGEVPAIVFSEAMGDLQKIAGKNQAAGAEEG